MKPMLFALLLPATVAVAQAPLAVVTYPIPVHVENANRGLFIDLVKTVASEAGVPIRISVQPPPRALHNFAGGTQAMLFPALDVLFPVDATIVRSKEAIDCKEDFVFTRQGTPRLTSLEDLKGRRVGVTRGYPYAREVNDGELFIVEPASTDEANLKKLVAGHIDAFILDEKTGIHALEATGLSRKVQYDETRPVSRQEVYYAFQNTPEGRQLAERFSAALAELKKDGRYQSLTRGITFAEGCAL